MSHWKGLHTNFQKKWVNTSTELLMFGYVRNIKITKNIIPSAIILLCIQFYHSNMRIICLEETSSFAKISVAIFNNFDQTTQWKCNVEPLSKNTMYDKKFPVEDSAICSVNNFNLPKNISKLLDSNKLYDIIFILGGYSGEDTVYCNGYIIDSKQYLASSDNYNIKAYHWKLPNLPSKVRGSCALYSGKYGLIQVGGYAQNILNQLKFDPDMKWNRYSYMKRTRSYSSTTWITDDKLIICGGYNSGSYLKFADVYDFNDDQWTELSNMNHSKCRSGILYNKYTKSTVYSVGGKDSASLKYAEYCDINKDIWISLPNTNEYHNGVPVMWMENSNILYITAAFCNCIERIDLRQNKWEVVSIDSSTSRNLFAINAKSYKIRFCLG